MARLPNKRLLSLAIAALSMLALGTVWAQRGGFGGGFGGRQRGGGFGGGYGGGFGGGYGGGRGGQYADYNPPPRDIFPGNSFCFCRIRYTSDYSTGKSSQGWGIDYPLSDINLSRRLAELTTIRIEHGKDGRIQHAMMDLTDPDLDKYPIIFFTEPGAMALTPAEQEALRSYLLRGGFMVVDDCHGDDQWGNLAEQMNEVLPASEYPINDLPMNHPLFHIVFDIKEVPQVITIHIYDQWRATGDTVEWQFGHDYSSGDTGPHCRGFYDKRGRLMGVFNHNTDLGDGWEEESTNPEYFRDFSVKKAYPMGINIVTYAMTH